MAQEITLHGQNGPFDAMQWHVKSPNMAKVVLGVTYVAPLSMVHKITNFCVTQMAHM